LYPDGASHEFSQGIPPSWAMSEKGTEIPTSLPAKGMFTFGYNCSADGRKMNLRRDLARKYGGWQLHDSVIKEVVWWAQLEDTPVPVLCFLYYCLREFRGRDKGMGVMNYAFYMIDGPGGNGDVSYIEMKEAMAEWGWGKFKRNEDYLRQVFRFLDPDGGGEISKAEWSTMNQLFKDLLLIMMEFMYFVDRFFGNFDSAWTELDEDNSDSIDAEEWGHAVTSIGFFGPSDVIFQYLTNDTIEDKKRRKTTIEDNSALDCVTRSGWQELQEVWEDKDNIKKQIMSLDPDDKKS